MAEVIIQFATALAGPGGLQYQPRVCGRTMPQSSLWEGWIEFVPQDDGPVLRTRRETEQPNRADLAYWASGLSTTYLEGALARAQDPPRLRRRETTTAPAYSGPAPDQVEEHPASPQEPHGVLDPFAVYGQGEEVLRQELVALEAWHLRDIIRAQHLADEATLDLTAMSRSALSELIVAAVRKQRSPRSHD